MELNFIMEKSRRDTGAGIAKIRFVKFMKEGIILSGCRTSKVL